MFNMILDTYFLPTFYSCKRKVTPSKSGPDIEGLSPQYDDHVPDMTAEFLFFLACILSAAPSGAHD